MCKPSTTTAWASIQASPESWPSMPGALVPLEVYLLSSKVCTCCTRNCRLPCCYELPPADRAAISRAPVRLFRAPSRLLRVPSRLYRARPGRFSGHNKSNKGLLRPAHRTSTYSGMVDLCGKGQRRSSRPRKALGPWRGHQRRHHHQEMPHQGMPRHEFLPPHVTAGHAMSRVPSTTFGFSLLVK